MHSSPQIPLYVVTSVYVCVCVRKCFACAPYSISFFPPSSSCETSRKPSIILMTITTCISICWPQMSRRAVVWLDSERASKERRKQRLETLGPLSGDPLPTQGLALSTPAHTQLQRHTDDSREAVFEQWQQVLLSLLPCLLVIQSTDTERFCCFHLDDDSQTSHILKTVVLTKLWNGIHSIYCIHVIPLNVMWAEWLIYQSINWGKKSWFW